MVMASPTATVSSNSLHGFGLTKMAMASLILPGSAGKEVTDVVISDAMDENGRPLDLNGDGIPDIVLAVDCEHNLIYYGEDSPDTGDFSETQPTEIGVPSTDSGGSPEDPIKETVSVDLIDVDGDGDIDVVFGNADGTTSTYYNEGGVLKKFPDQPPSPPPHPPISSLI